MTVSRMFPIIPQHQVVAPRNKSRVSVVAATDIPLHTCTGPLLVHDIVHTKLDQLKYELQVDKSSILVVKGEASAGWVRYTRISADCHSCNVIVHRSADSEQPAVFLQTVRELRAGDDLKLWFDEELLAAISIPFLTPNNIHGEKNYICHKCNRLFEYPNPLKLHISLECGTLRRVEIWKRLTEANYSAYKSSDTRTSITNPKFMFSFDLKGPSNSLDSVPGSPNNHCFSTNSNQFSFDLSRKVELSKRPSSEPSVGRFSAFKPYLNFQTQNTTSDHNSTPLISVPSNLIFSSTPVYSSPTFPGVLKVEPEEQILMEQQAVEVETLVSNLGKSKQGHLCIYCGKIYSRKYGLKIHIRTHTGFKPLKCKFCLRPFGDPSNLNKHVRLHAEGETPYKCEECGKVLVRRRDLERHIKSRHLQQECL